MRDLIPCYAPDFGQEERMAVMQHLATTQFITAGPWVDKFEREFAKRLGRQYGVMTNSGSSSILIAVKAMGWPAGTEVATPALTFPTDVAALVNLGMVPVFVDCFDTYNADANQLYDLSQKGIKAALLPHMFGIPLPEVVWTLFDKTVEDNCDALGTTINGRMTGAFGTVSCHSFYPAHHITTGEGGMCVTANHDVYSTLFSLVSWGRDCYCRPGYDDSCGNRWGHKISGIDYDHKYIAKTCGFNLKPLEMCGILGRLQLNKLDKYAEIRKRNFEYLYKRLVDCEDVVKLPVMPSGADPSWFAFPIFLKKGDRTSVCKRIEARGVQVRMPMAGNITLHPMMDGVPHRVPFGLDRSTEVMRQTFLVGVNHTITEEECEHIAKVVIEEISI